MMWNRNGVTERLCKELGWSVDERDGHFRTLYFTGDDINKKRDVIIHEDDSNVIIFSGYASAQFQLSSLPNDLAAWMLARSAKRGFAKWHLAETNSGEVYFATRYQTDPRSVNSRLFSLICKEFVCEIAEVERTFHQKGLM